MPATWTAHRRWPHVLATVDEYDESCSRRFTSSSARATRVALCPCCRVDHMTFGRTVAMVNGPGISGVGTKDGGNQSSRQVRQ